MIFYVNKGFALSIELISSCKLNCCKNYVLMIEIIKIPLCSFREINDVNKLISVFSEVKASGLLENVEELFSR